MALIGFRHGGASVYVKEGDFMPVCVPCLDWKVPVNLVAWLILLSWLVGLNLWEFGGRQCFILKGSPVRLGRSCPLAWIRECLLISLLV